MKLYFRLRTPKDYLDFIQKRKWWIIVPALIIGPIASFIVYKLPAIYVSSTVILVEPQKIDPNFVRNPVTVSVKDRLNQIRNKITSSTNLALIVEKFGLFEDQTFPLTEQAKIDLLRRRIEIYVDRPSGGSETSQVSYFSISFQDKSPKLAQNVTAEVASQFLTEEEKQSKEKIVKTSNFIDSQIAERLKVLEAKKRELSQARLQNIVNMPFDAATYAKQLDSLEAEIDGVREGLDRWKDKLMSLERDLSTTPKTIEKQIQVYDEAAQSNENVPSSPASAANTIDYTAIQAEIDRLKRTYTDEHPDVRRLTRQLESLKAQAEQNSKTEAKSAEAKPESSAPVSKTVTSPNPVYRRLTGQVTQVKRTIETQQIRLASLEKQKVVLESRLNQWPQITQIIADKTAELQSLETEYNALQAKQQEARLSMELINRAQTEQFRIQDPANLPERSIKPDRPKLYLVSWLLALGVGILLALARDVTDLTIRTPSDILMFHPVPILVSVPTILTESEKMAERRRHRYLLGMYILSGVSLIGIFAYAALNEHLMRLILDYINVYFA